MPLKQINSKVDGKLLHIIYWPGDETGRVPITPESQILQAAAINLTEGQTFKAHKHLPTIRETMGTQESWIVIRGTVEAILYDVDDTIITRELLSPGCLSITFRGGHNYRSLTSNTLVYEFKNGPYMGVVADKVFIETNHRIFTNEASGINPPDMYQRVYDMGSRMDGNMPDIESPQIKHRETWGEYDG